MTRKDIHNRAVDRMTQRAQERHRLLENARVRAEEHATFEKMHTDIAAFLRKEANR